MKLLRYIPYLLLVISVVFNLVFLNTALITKTDNQKKFSELLSNEKRSLEVIVDKLDNIRKTSDKEELDSLIMDTIEYVFEFSADTRTENYYFATDMMYINLHRDSLLATTSQILHNYLLKNIELDLIIRRLEVMHNVWIMINEVYQNINYDTVTVDKFREALNEKANFVLAEYSKVN